MTGRTGAQLRASRRRRMADDIELAALRLFAARGIDAVTVEDIADAADISRRTFFRYYASKDDVLLGDPEQHLEIVRAALASIPASTGAVMLLRRSLLALAAGLEERREAVLLRKRIAAQTPDAFARQARQSTDAVDALVGVLATTLGVDPDLDLRPKVYVHAALGAMQAAIQLWLAAGTKDSLERLVEQALDLILPGSDPGRGSEHAATELLCR